VNSPNRIGEDNLQSLSRAYASIRTGLREITTVRIPYSPPACAVEELNQLWRCADSILGFAPPHFNLAPTLYARAEHREPLYELEKPECYIGMTDQFIKDILNIDRKLQGRILEAISYIRTKPNFPRGDTVKPMVGKLKGLWRIRIGDYRLIYHPYIGSKRVVLISLASRGKAY
jgi:mRNA interferase RelE/StbE